MATHTLKTNYYETLDGSLNQNRSILCHAKNVKGLEIYYQYEDETEAPVSDETVDVLIAATTPAAAITTTTAVSSPSSGPVTCVKDISIKAINVLLAIVAQKLKKRVDKILLSKSIKDLVGGKSTQQNAWRFQFLGYQELSHQELGTSRYLTAGMLDTTSRLTVKLMNQLTTEVRVLLV